MSGSQELMSELVQTIMKPPSGLEIEISRLVEDMFKDRSPEYRREWTQNVTKVIFELARRTVQTLIRWHPRWDKPANQKVGKTQPDKSATRVSRARPHSKAV